MKTACCSPQGQFSLDGDKALDVCSGQRFNKSVSGDADKGVIMADPAWPVVSKTGFCMMFTKNLRVRPSSHPACTGDSFEERGGFSHYLKSEGYVKHRGACLQRATLQGFRSHEEKPRDGLPQCSVKVSEYRGGGEDIGCNFPKVRNHHPVVVHISHLLGFHEQLFYNYKSQVDPLGHLLLWDCL